MLNSNTLQQTDKLVKSNKSEEQKTSHGRFRGLALQKMNLFKTMNVI
jgi:hypothetical protein